ncbi:hypothetical protein A2U01_0034048 [Trifolium medium]|uniref:Uncharacterized protein n=1 Tax=Trifolium medium TaxID=97028 RepID=A0A392PLI7_9FABA|nr:hypothetical protein [Trifolium medium]
MPLGGAMMELDNLRKLLKETTLREEDVVGRLGASEHQVRILSNRLKDYDNSDLGLLRKDNTELRSRVDFLESELHAFRDFRYSAFKDANEKVARLERKNAEANEKIARLEEEKAELNSSLKEYVVRALDLAPAIFKNALEQVELYLKRSLPREKFSVKHYVKDGKLVPRTVPK